VAEKRRRLETAEIITTERAFKSRGVPRVMGGDEERVVVSLFYGDCGERMTSEGLHAKVKKSWDEKGLEERGEEGKRNIRWGTCRLGKRLKNPQRRG